MGIPIFFLSCYLNMAFKIDHYLPLRETTQLTIYTRFIMLFITYYMKADHCIIHFKIKSKIINR